MPTAIVHHPVFEKHDTGPDHPETPERYRVVIDALRGDSALWSNVVEIEAGDFLEHANVHGRYYGTTREPLISNLQNGVDVLIDSVKRLLLVLASNATEPRSRRIDEHEIAGIEQARIIVDQ